MVNKTTNTKLKIINLYKSDYLAQYHVREMAKFIDKSHVTLLPHLKSLEEDKILIPKTIGKNKVYSLNLDNILTKNYLEICAIIESITFLEDIFLIKKISGDIFQLNLSGTVILFGSYAKRTFQEDSDIDIFYLGDIEQNQIEEIKKIGKTYGKTINMKKLTLTDFEIGIRKKDPLIIEIIKNHITLQNPEPFINLLWRYYHEKR